MSTSQLAAMIATALALAGALSQVRRLVRTGDTSGVSLSGATLGVTSELGWMAYTLHERLWSAVPEVVLMTVTNTLLALVLMRSGVSLVRPLASAMLWGAVLAIGTGAGGWNLLGTMLPIAYAVQVVPSIWSAFRTWAPSGIDVMTWALILVESMLWGVYGMASRDPALTLFAVIGTTASTAIVGRVLVTRDRVRAVRRERSLTPAGAE